MPPNVLDKKMWQLTIYYHLRPPDTMPLPKCFWAREQQRLNFDGFIYIRYAAPPYSAGISAIYLAPFGKVLLGSVCWPPCAKPGDEVEGRIYGGWVKLRSHFKPFLDQSSQNLQTPLSDCLCHVLFRRYSLLSLEVVEKPNKCKSFWPHFGRDDFDFSTADC